ncbi:hypothetical protein DFH08DRAFT_820066 [Mycena albidolilacea]|uniref:Uncharacterized protein n=1 Tax=Mycena albidolilacea TaxID=1033008 RepID=A0AAD6ZD71_9AGAR|nr:hypothetical protein DFH08DRAFT_820066 [Mycena albidolilacea]
MRLVQWNNMPSMLRGCRASEDPRAGLVEEIFGTVNEDKLNRKSSVQTQFRKMYVSAVRSAERLLSHAMWHLSSESQSGFNSAVLTVSQPQNRIRPPGTWSASSNGLNAPLLLNIPDSGLILQLPTSGIMSCVEIIVRIVQSYNCVPCHVDAAGEELEGAGQSVGTHRTNGVKNGRKPKEEQTSNAIWGFSTGYEQFMRTSNSGTCLCSLNVPIRRIVDSSQSFRRSAEAKNVA